MGKIVLNYIYLSREHAGGKDQVGINLLKGFKDNGVCNELMVICYDYSYDLIRNIAPEVEIKTIKSHSCKNELQRLWNISYANTFIIPKILKEVCAAMILHISPANGFRKYKVSSAVIPHDIKAISHRVMGKVKIPLFKYYIYKIMYAMDFRHADIIVAISDYDKNEISQYYPQYKNKVHRIYNPIKLEEFPCDIHREKKNVVALNLQFHHKNIITLIKAFESIKDRVKCKLVLVGAVPPRVQYLKDYVAEHELTDIIEFTGFVSSKDKRELLINSQLYVNPSLFEGFGMTAVEAMILKVPTLLSKVSANYEVTRGLCNYYEPADDYVVLGNAIIECLGKSYDYVKLCDISEKMIENYDYRLIADKYLDLFHKQINKDKESSVISISVITPVYHGGKYISKLIDMVNQSAVKLNEVHRAAVEYIIVNDSPSEKIKELSNYKKDNIIVSVKVIENEKNCGIHQSRINGLKKSTGEYVVFLDQDDEISEEFLLSQYESIGNADIVAANGYRISKTYKKPIYKSKWAHNMVKSYKTYIYGTDMIFSPGQCMIKKQSIPREWYRYVMDINGCDDFLLWLVMFNRSCRFAINNGKIYNHIDNEFNYSASGNSMAESYTQLCDILEKNTIIPRKQVKVLRSRYKLRMDMKKSGIIRRILGLIKHPVIIWYTFKYKISGYY